MEDKIFLEESTLLSINKRLLKQVKLSGKTEPCFHSAEHMIVNLGSLLITWVQVLIPIFLIKQINKQIILSFSTCGGLSD